MSTRYLLPQSDVDITHVQSYDAGSWPGSTAVIWSRINDATDNPAAAASEPANNGDTDGLFLSSLTEYGYIALDGDLPAGAAVSGLTIRLWAMQVAAEPGAYNATIKAVVQIGGVDYDLSPDVVIDETQAYQLVTFTQDTNPATGAAWTAAELNALTIGLAAQSGSGNGVMVSALSALATYTAGDAGGDWTYTVNRARGLAVDATGVTAPEGYTISSYAWNWGDGTPAGAGVTASHTYAVRGTYTVTLTLTLNSGETITLPKEITIMALAITAVTPLHATRGATGTAITITCTDAGATQDTSTLTIGGVAVIVDSWSATSIVCHADDSPATPLGAQDLVLTVGGVAVTLEKQIYVYDDTDNKDATEIELGMVDEVFLDGLQVGFTSDALDMEFGTREVEYEPADRMDTVQVFSYTGPTQVRVRFDQLDGTLMAKLLGGTYTEATRVLEVAGNDTFAEHSLMIIESSGAVHLFKRVKITGTVTLSLNKTVRGIPVTFRVLSLNEPSARKYESRLPA